MIADVTVEPAGSGEGDVLEALRRGDYDFLDFGCSDGGSFRLAQKFLGLGRGLGLDIDPAKVRKARAAGFEAQVQDVTQLKGLDGCVRAVLLSHFLEHLPSRKQAQVVLRAAVRAAREYVFVRQPFFDANPELLRLGLKLYSADWTGHANLMTSFDVWQSLRPLIDRREVALALLGRKPVKSSDNPAIVPIGSPPNLHKADLEAIVRPPTIAFDFKAYVELLAVVVRRRRDGSLAADWRALAGSLGYHSVLGVYGEDPSEAAEPQPRPPRRAAARAVAQAARADLEPALPAPQPDGRRYLFVCGVARSGTTALTKLLNAHPKIAVGIERFKYHLGKAANRNLSAQELFTAERFFDFRPTDTNVVATRDYERLEAKFDACTVVGDKIPSLYRYANSLFVNFPGSTIVFITRDVETVAASWQKRADNPDDGWPDHNGHEAAVDEWNRGVEIALDLASRWPGRFLVVRYDQLFNGDPGVLEALVSSLGLEPDRELADAYRSSLEAAEAIERTPLPEPSLKRVRERADYDAYGRLKALAIGC